MVTAVCLVPVALVMIIFRNVVLGSATAYVLVCIALVIVGTEWSMVLLSILLTVSGRSDVSFQIPPADLGVGPE